MSCAGFLPTMLLLLPNLDPVEPYTKVLDIGHNAYGILAPLRRMRHDTAVVKDLSRAG